MRLAVIDSRLALVDERGAIDVAAVSAGIFSPDPQAIYQQCDHSSRIDGLDAVWSVA